MAHVIIYAMSYSIDLRERVIGFVKQGGQKTEAARIFNVGRRTVHRWLQRPELTPSKRTSNGYKLKKDALQAHVDAYPDALLRERAVYFGVRLTTVSEALKKMGIRKKNAHLF
jgi:transposase